MDSVRFDLGEPFLPFEQLLGCLPGASAGFLPSAYARLMTSPESPIIDFYPEDFEVRSILNSVAIRERPPPRGGGLAQLLSTPLKIFSLQS